MPRHERYANEDRTKPDWYVIADDDTNVVAIPSEGKKYIDAIITVYFFNKNERTYLAESVPSYHLVYGYTTVWFKRNVSERVREKLYDKYTDASTESTYRHVSSVDSFLRAHPKRVYHYGATDPEETDGGEREVLDYIRGNPPF